MLPLIFINKIKINNMTPKEKAEQLYKDAYIRWCYELSHDKNVSIAKNIANYICDEILQDREEIDGMRVINDPYWVEVKQEIQKL
jgi:hypothetical protein